MPEYQVRLPDGRVVKVTGPAPPPPTILSVIGDRVRKMFEAPPKPVYGPPLRQPAPVTLAPWQLAVNQGVETAYDFGKGLTLGTDILNANAPRESTAQGVGALLGAALPFAGALKLVGEAPAAARGLWSRVDDVVSRLPTKGTLHPNKVAAQLKSGASAEELAYRKVPEFLAQKGNAPVSRAELEAHLAAHPAPLPQTKTLGASTDPAYVHAARDFLSRGTTPEETFTGLRRAYRMPSDEQLRDAIYAAQHPDYPTAAPKYQTYTLPGGESYRESLYTLPDEVAERDYALQQRLSTAVDRLKAYLVEQKAFGATTVDDYILDVGRNELTSGQIRFAQSDPEQWRLMTEVSDAYRARATQHQGAQPFQSGHFNQPNVLAHARTTERTLPTGERGRFVEEVQSDWHQAGKKRGYNVPGEQYVAFYRAANQEMVPLGHGATEAAARAAIPQGWDTIPGVSIEVRRQPTPAPYGAVPDAPFKESWPDLALKQQLLDAAQDPETQWLGFTSGETQAARYDLSKQIDELKWYRDGDGYRISAKKDGEILVQKSAMSPQELSATVGKEMADKIIANAEQHGAMTGIDLKVGGEGMRKFYDELLPARLRKLVKQFGGTVERVPLTGGRSRAVIDAEMDALMQQEGRIPHDRLVREYNRLQEERNLAMGGAGADEGWIVRLTPEMKARIVKEGLPLMAIPLAALAGSSAQEKQP